MSAGKDCTVSAFSPLTRDDSFPSLHRYWGVPWIYRNSLSCLHQKGFVWLISHWENEISALVSSVLKAIGNFPSLLCHKGIPVKDSGLGMKLQGCFSHAGVTEMDSLCFNFLLLCGRVLWKKGSRSPLFIPAIKVHLCWSTRKTLCYHSGFLKCNFKTICIFAFAIYRTYLHSSSHYKTY